ncbi:heavy metal-binding domain-containing protein [Sphingobacterium sp. BIGb0116]|uniref:heavy metal-binding domain-containing protein n=1 Tax=Sphingobacterium sp. BIGb0116 TaxID=2940619 RepID=UPI0038F70D75
MIVTTTNSIEGREISRYNDPIAANVVIGTTVFSDIGASYIGFILNKLKLLRFNYSIVRNIFTTIC